MSAATPKPPRARSVDATSLFFLALLSLSLPALYGLLSGDAAVREVRRDNSRQQEVWNVGLHRTGDRSRKRHVEETYDAAAVDDESARAPEPPHAEPGASSRADPGFDPGLGSILPPPSPAASPVAVDAFVLKQQPAIPATMLPAAASMFSGYAGRPEKYLMLVQGQEGFGAWSDIVWEFFDAAKRLNRTLVEPCVRNGCLEPCRCGKVLWVDIHKDNLEQFDNGGDPLNLPYISYPCEPHTGSRRTERGPAFPLRAYLDLSILRKYWPHVMPYEEWCENVMKPTPGIPLDEHGRWKLPFGYCGELHAGWCGTGQKAIGDFVFEREEFGRNEPVERQLEILAGDAFHTAFYFGYYRWFFKSKDSFRTVPFNPGHIRAVEQYLATNFGSTPVVAFHWRSEHVAEDMLVPCSENLATIVAALKWPATPSGARALLMSDMPSINHHHIIWHTYEGGNNANRRNAMATLMDAGLVKYDFTHNDTDTGVLMIRDLVFAMRADQYVTCQGDFVNDCHGCFRSTSNFVSRILEMRNQAQLWWNDKWWLMKQADIPGAATPPEKRWQQT